MRRVLTFWNKSLMARLVGYFLPLSLLTASLVGYIAFWQGREALKQSIYDRLDAVAAIKEDGLTRWIDEQRRNVVFIAWLPEVQTRAGILLGDTAAGADRQAAYALLSQYLEYVIKSTTDSKELVILDLQGNIVLSTDKSREGQTRGKEPYFLQGQSGTFVQNVYASPATGKPTITIATPLFNQAKERVGVLAAHLDLSRIDRIILERTGLGQTGQAYLVSRSKEFVSETLSRQVPARSGLDSTGIDEALAGQDGYGLYRNYAGAPVVGVYRWIDQGEVALLVEMSQQEAFAPAERLGWTIAGAGLLVAMALAIFISLAARRLTSPVFDLVSGAERMAQGQLDQPVPVRSEDELGLLARSFNAMQASLRQSYAQLEEYARTLEQRVAERTAALQAEIAERAQAEAELRALFAAMMSDVIFVLDAQGRYVKIAPTSPPHLYRPLPEMIGMRMHDLLPTPQADLFLGYIQRALATRETATTEYKLQIGDAEIWFEASIVPLAAETVYWVAHDITSRKQMEQALRQQNEYLNALHDTTLGLISRLDLTDLLEAIVNRAAALGGTSHGYVYLLEPDKTAMRLQIGIGIHAERLGIVIKPGEGLSGIVWQTGEPLVVNDYNTWAGRLPAFAESELRAVVGVPLTSGSQVVGVIGLSYLEEGRKLGQNEVEILNRFAGLASIALDNARLYTSVQQELSERKRAEQALRESQRRLETSYRREQERLRLSNTLREVAKIVSGALDPQKVLDLILNQLEKVVTCHYATVTLVTGDVLTLVAKHDKRGSIPANLVIPISRFPLNMIVLESKRPLLVPDVTRDERWVPDKATPYVRSFINTPLLVQDRPVGLLAVMRSDETPYTEEDAQIVFAFANQVAVALERARLYEYELKQVERELEIARQIQMSLLPPEAPSLRGLDIAAFSQAAHHTGGDFYNYFVFDQDHLGIAVGDVSGKGMQAALMMALSFGLLTNQVRHDVAPADLLTEMNREVRPHTLRNNLNTALCYLTLKAVRAAEGSGDGDTWTARVANAGLISPLLRRADGRVEWVDVQGLPLGTQEENTFVELRQTLARGDALIVCSDGIVEAMNEAKQLYSFDRLVARIQAAPPLSTQALREWILEDVRAFVGQADTHDDITLIIVTAA